MTAYARPRRWSRYPASQHSASFRAQRKGQAGDALIDPRSAISEAYRSFATALQFSTESGLPRSIAVTSAGPGEGNLTTVLALARHFAQMGLRVLLIDGDLRKPSLHTKQGLDNSIGFSNFLTGRPCRQKLYKRQTIQISHSWHPALCRQMLRIC